VSDLVIDRALVGRRVQNAARPEWGAGEVLRVHTAVAGGQAVHRVSIQFAVGHKTVLVPPARLIQPGTADAPQPAGWIDRLAGQTPQDRLRALPESVTDVLGTAAQRVAALVPLYEIEIVAAGIDGRAADARDGNEPAGGEALAQWARRQSGVGGPLARWSRDEHLRGILAQVRKTGGAAGVDDVLATVAVHIRERMRRAL
jgi:hypothetical protein